MPCLNFSSNVHYSNLFSYVIRIKLLRKTTCIRKFLTIVYNCSTGNSPTIHNDYCNQKYHNWLNYIIAYIKRILYNVLSHRGHESSHKPNMYLFCLEMGQQQGLHSRIFEIVYNPCSLVRSTYQRTSKNRNPLSGIKILSDFKKLAPDRKKKTIISLATTVIGVNYSA